VTVQRDDIWLANLNPTQHGMVIIEETDLRIACEPTFSAVITLGERFKPGKDDTIRQTVDPRARCITATRPARLTESQARWDGA
jgi:hypothetical protein